MKNTQKSHHKLHFCPIFLTVAKDKRPSIVLSCLPPLGNMFLGKVIDGEEAWDDSDWQRKLS